MATMRNFVIAFNKPKVRRICSNKSFTHTHTTHTHTHTNNKTKNENAKRHVGLKMYTMGKYVLLIMLGSPY